MLDHFWAYDSLVVFQSIISNTHRSYLSWSITGLLLSYVHATLVYVNLERSRSQLFEIAAIRQAAFHSFFQNFRININACYFCELIFRGRDQEWEHGCFAATIVNDLATECESIADAEKRCGLELLPTVSMLCLLSISWIKVLLCLHSGGLKNSLQL